MSNIKTFEELYDDQWLGTNDPKEATLAIMQEVSEAMNELDWKYWKKKEINVDKFREELSDIFIFLMMTAKITGLSAKEFLDITIKKHEFNKVRKDHDKNK